MSHSKTIKVGDFTLSREVLAEGFAGKIIKAHYVPHNSILAVKMISLAQPGKRKAFDNEAHISHVCKSNPHAIPIRKLFTHDGMGFIAMQLFDTTLFTLIQQKKRLSSRRSVCYFAQICKGVSFIHKHNIAHLNLCPHNVLISLRDSNAFVSDYGNSFYLETDQNIGEGLFQLGDRGQEGFQAPEVLAPGSFYNPIKADIWSLGVILLAMISGFYFANDIVADELANIAGIPPDCMDLLSKMVVTDPKKRISIDDVLAHPFVTVNLPRERGSRSPMNRFRRLISHNR